MEYLQSLFVISLVMSGIGGLSFEMFKEEGWIETLLGDIWELHVQYPLVAVPLTVGAVILAKLWHEQRLATGRLSKLPDIFIVALMGAGIYFIGQYAIYGSL